MVCTLVDIGTDAPSQDFYIILHSQTLVLLNVKI